MRNNEMGTSLNGPSRHFAAARQFDRFWNQAAIGVHGLVTAEKFEGKIIRKKSMTREYGETNGQID
jgi:hypothetical protein